MYILDQEIVFSKEDTGSGNNEEANEAGATGLPTDTVVADESGVTETDKASVDVTSSADARVGKGEHGEGAQEIELPSIGKTYYSGQLLFHGYIYSTLSYQQLDRKKLVCKYYKTARNRKDSIIYERLIHAFFDVKVAFLYFDICH